MVLPLKILSPWGREMNKKRDNLSNKFISSLIVIFSYFIMLFSATSIVSDEFYDYIVHTIENRLYQSIILIIGFIAFTIGVANVLRLNKKQFMSYAPDKNNNINVENIDQKIDSDIENIIVEHTLQITSDSDVKNANNDRFSSHLHIILQRIELYKIYLMNKYEYFVSLGRSFFIAGIAVYFLCVLAFQIFIHISPENEIFKIYGMVSCAIIFVSIEFIGLWYLNQSKIYSNKILSMINIELHINKCELIYNLNMSENVIHDLLRMELQNTNIRLETYNQKTETYPYKIFFDSLRDVIKKEGR